MLYTGCCQVMGLRAVIEWHGLACCCYKPAFDVAAQGECVCAEEKGIS